VPLPGVVVPAVSVLMAPSAQQPRADPDFDLLNHDLVFASLLDRYGVLSNFNLEKDEAQTGCE
jgi:hypothetical protein